MHDAKGATIDRGMLLTVLVEGSNEECCRVNDGYRCINGFIHTSHSIGVDTTRDATNNKQQRNVILVLSAFINFPLSLRDISSLSEHLLYLLIVPFRKIDALFERSCGIPDDGEIFVCAFNAPLARQGET